MIEQDKRKAIYLLHSEGMKTRDISRQLRVNRNTVRAIIKQRGVIPDERRADRIEIDQELLSRLYDECCGRIQRIHEKLTEEEEIDIGYSTLSRMIRELGLGQDKSTRCGRVPDKPGAEMQHDTSSYTIIIGGRRAHVIGSIIYFRYSSRNPRIDAKMRYLKFYRSFNRFSMKCFFHEALTFFGYSASVCIIDNTNLARLRGAGSNAIISPEMEQFARQFGFSFVCHEIGHSNRKAGNERSFYTVETNFFPGRSFADFEDLNEQALQWATVRMPNRPVSKTMLIPAKAFASILGFLDEHEKPFLVKLPPYVSPPYLIHKRGIDQYGYLSFAGNYYWVPGTSRGEALVLQYSKTIEIYQSRHLLATYFLPKEGVKNKSFTPDGLPRPEHKPKNRHCPTLEEEKKLRAIDKQVDEYLNFALKEKGREKHKIIRNLFGLYQKITPSLFIKTIERALKYRITNMTCIERIAVLQMADGDIQIPSIEIDEQFQSRDAYREGCRSDEVDLAKYEKLIKESEDRCIEESEDRCMQEDDTNG